MVVVIDGAGQLRCEATTSTLFTGVPTDFYRVAGSGTHGQLDILDTKHTVLHKRSKFRQCNITQ